MDPTYSQEDIVLTPGDWRDAIYVQSASNMSGVAHSLPKAILKVREEAKRRDMPDPYEWASFHPIICMFIYKLSSMAGYEPLLWSYAEECYRLAEKKSLKED